MKLLLLLAFFLSGCLAFHNPFSQDVLRNIRSDEPPASCMFVFDKLSERPATCYCTLYAKTADRQWAIVVFEVPEIQCLGPDEDKCRREDRRNCA